MVTKEPCSIFSVRLYAPTVSQTVGNTRVTEGFGGDEGDLCDHPFKALETLISVHLELILYQKHVPESGSIRTSAGKEIIENPSYPTHKGHLHT